MNEVKITFEFRGKEHRVGAAWGEKTADSDPESVTDRINSLAGTAARQCQEIIQERMTTESASLR